VNPRVDCVLEHACEAPGVGLYGGVVVGTDECIQCRGEEGLAILPGDAGCQGELGGEAFKLKVVWGLSDCSSELCATARGFGSKSIWD
jgi:hypothetical protein